MGEDEKQFRYGIPSDSRIVDSDYPELEGIGTGGAASSAMFKIAE